jgi:hypothetical protein
VYDEDYRKRSPHVIISGRITAAVLTDFLNDFYFEVTKALPVFSNKAGQRTLSLESGCHGSW